MTRYKLSLTLGLLFIIVLVGLTGCTNTKATSQKQDSPDLSSMQSKNMMVDTIEVTAQRPEMEIDEIVVTAPHPDKIQTEKELSQIKPLPPNLKSLQ